MDARSDQGDAGHPSAARGAARARFAARRLYVGPLAEPGVAQAGVPAGNIVGRLVAALSVLRPPRPFNDYRCLSPDSADTAAPGRHVAPGGTKYVYSDSGVTVSYGVRTTRGPPTAHAAPPRSAGLTGRPVEISVYFPLCVIPNSSRRVPSPVVPGRSSTSGARCAVVASPGIPARRGARRSARGVWRGGNWYAARS